MKLAERIKKEPVLFMAGIKAILYVFMAFGLHITVDQLATIMVAVEAVTMFFTRAQVTPVVSLKTVPEKEN